ncbi:MAG: DEAD/DEAH box helicase [Xanthomonadaceae bacterium]|jgi:ATP-dependent RNA helicase DeaD|nr:DEAD/DEAH box helicase [Xanthomonadaceae bacterium]
MSADTDPANEAPSLRFADLALPESLMKALAAVGYESPSPIQAATIPPLLAGRDVLGQAQTGTGKTAAFALPLLARIAEEPAGTPKVVVLAPTRELAIQVAEAFQKYAAFLPGFQVLPIYGGQAYGPQLGALKRGVHVVVGTPGRVIDHLERGSLDLSQLRALVLDEADEMLRMGFIDDVEAVLKKTPPQRQVALFSATMPPPIRRIAQTYLKDPVEVAIQAKTTTATNIRQRMWMVSGLHKLDALTRILEAETFDAMIVFARTKQATQELAEKLAARGLAAAAIHGDVQQAQRERTIQQLKDRKIDILVATDVAARGLDVERISHVLNYDIPYDTESYVHRIGRTGRAGRSGEAILFVSPRERGMLKAIERATRQPIEPMTLPSVQAVNDSRITRFLDRITQARQLDDVGVYRSLVERYETEHNVPAIEIAAALARLLQGDTPLLMEPPSREARVERESGGERPERPERRERVDFDRLPRQPRGEPMSWRPETRAPREGAAPKPRPPKFDSAPRPPEPGFATYWIAVGHAHQVKPGNIVGAIANEAGLDAAHIGRINIRTHDTLVDLPEGMPKEVMAHLKKVRVAGQALMLKAYDPSKDDGGEIEGAAPRFPKKGGFKPGGFKPGGSRPGGFKGRPKHDS